MPDDAYALLAGAVQRRLSGEGPMTMAELTEQLRVDADDIYDALDHVGDESITPLVDGRWVHGPSVLDGRVFTHRVGAVEVAHDLLDEEPDLDVLLHLPRAQLRLGSGERLTTAVPGLDQPADQRPVPAEVLAGAGSLVLPPGALAAVGAGAGDLVGLEVTPTGLLLSRVDPAGLADPDGVQAALARVLRPDEPVDLSAALLAVCADTPEVFVRPVLPVAELIAAAGLSHLRGFLAPAGFDIAAYQTETRTADLAEAYELSESEARAAVVLVDHAGGRIERGLDEVAAALPFLAEPAVADAVLRSVLPGFSTAADDLVGLADELGSSASRAVRPALQWLRAKAYEWRGEVLAAEEALRAAERLDPDWPLTLLDLARYASDRGDAVRGLALLRRADPYEDPELEELLEPVQPVAGPVVGRNDPCWCGSGRKFKQCHLHRPAERPLAERAHWLWSKARRYLEDGRWPYRVMEVTAGRIAYSEDEDVLDGAPDGPLVTDVVLFEGGAFAEFLEVRGSLLPADERALAEQWLRVDRGVFAVTAVRRGEGMTLRDLRTDDVHEVRELAGSSSLRTGDLICARVVPAGDTTQILGGIEPVRPDERDDLQALLDSEPEPDELVAFLTG